MKAVGSRPRPVSRTVREKIYLTYPRKLLKEPVIHQLGHKFRIVTNIRTASISAEMGLIALELDGAESEVRAAIRWLEGLGIQVEPIAKNVIE